MVAFYHQGANMKTPENPWRKTHADVLQEAAASMIKLSTKLELVVRGLQVHLKNGSEACHDVVASVANTRLQLSNAICQSTELAGAMLRGDTENRSVADDPSDQISPEDLIKKMMGT